MTSGRCSHCGAELPDEIIEGTGVYCESCGTGQHVSDGGFRESDAVLAARASKLGPVVPGSDRDECAECGKDVWLSPGTRRAQRTGIYPDRVVCVTCATGEESEG